jgi:ATP:ADP antiporter, AAA family
LVANGSLVGMAVASFLIWNARFMGNKFDEYTASGHIVGGDNEEDNSNLRMAMGQNDNKDTSCAIYDDDSVGPEEEGQSESAGSDEDGDAGAEFAIKKKKQPEVTMV